MNVSIFFADPKRTNLYQLSRVYRTSIMPNRDTASAGAVRAPPPPMPPWQRVTIALYFFALVLLSLYVFVVAWLYEPNGDSGEFSLFNGLISFKADAELRVVLLVSATGTLGSLVYMGNSFIYHAGFGDLSSRWFWWYLKRPALGALLSLIAYFVLRGGLLTATSGELNIYGILALSGLTGLFSRQAIDKLADVFDTVVKKRESEETRKA
jgi:hypothetical protein